jgi:polyisoprenoid-binding protein YceI
MASPWDGICYEPKTGELSLKLTTKAKFCFAALPAYVTLCAALCCAQTAAAPATVTGALTHKIVLQFDGARSGADITLPTALHTVEGSFAFKRGNLRYDPATGKVEGEIVFDAASGKTGNGSRDNKMHKDVLESPRYAEIVFHPDRLDGAVAASGTSSVKIHGMFGIHGADHEVTMPVEFSLNGGSWSATSAFPVPFVQWGMKDPSVLFLRVNKSVQVKLHAGGSAQ